MLTLISGTVYLNSIPWGKKQEHILQNSSVKQETIFQMNHIQFQDNRQRRSQDGRGIGRGDHFLFYKFIERTTEWWTKFTKQLLIVSSGTSGAQKSSPLSSKGGRTKILKIKKGTQKITDSKYSKQYKLQAKPFLFLFSSVRTLLSSTFLALIQTWNAGSIQREKEEYLIIKMFQTKNSQKTFWGTWTYSPGK